MAMVVEHAAKSLGELEALKKSMISEWALKEQSLRAALKSAEHAANAAGEETSAIESERASLALELEEEVRYIFAIVGISL
jgi:predicted  nucleic acid-binding Zn-ribbon protein